jgi:hypothetical protein
MWAPALIIAWALFVYFTETRRKDKERDRVRGKNV